MPSLSYDCTVCCETKTVPRFIVDGGPVCHPCMVTKVIPLFINALKFEAQYPVTWGPDVLSPDEFEHLLPKGFLRDWREKEKEYRTPLLSRIYCPHALYHEDSKDICGMFLGRKHAEDCPVSALRCLRCGGITCGKGCGAALFALSEAHECAGRTIDAQHGLEGLQRGRDYQICPNSACGLRVTLKDGCNFVQCPSSSCKTGMCFVCGVGPLVDSSNHWTRGCPRYNQPGADNALFDESDDEDPDLDQLPLPNLPPPASEDDEAWVMNNTDPEMRAAVGNLQHFTNTSGVIYAPEVQPHLSTLRRVFFQNERARMTAIRDVAAGREAQVDRAFLTEINSLVLAAFLVMLLSEVLTPSRDILAMRNLFIQGHRVVRRAFEVWPAAVFNHYPGLFWALNSHLVRFPSFLRWLDGFDVAE